MPQRSLRNLIGIPTICTVFFVVFAFYAVLRHQALWTLYFDLGAYANSLWKVINGLDTVASLVLPSTPGHIGHVSPVLLPVIPYYAALPFPESLLILQIAVLSLSVVPLYKLAELRLRSKTIASLVSVSYLLNPALHGVARYDFHVEAFLPLFILSALYAKEAKKRLLYYAALLFSLFVIEFSAVIVMTIGLVEVIYEVRNSRKSHKSVFGCGIPTLLLGVAFLLIAIATTAIFTPGNKTLLDWLYASPLFSSSQSSGSYTQPLVDLARDPLLILNAIQHDASEKLLYLIILLAPTSFLALRKPKHLIPALPWVLIALLSSSRAFYTVYFQYQAFVVPFVYVATIYTLRTDISWKRIAASIVVPSMLLALTFSVLSPVSFYTETPYFTIQNSWWPAPSADYYRLKDIKSLIPQDSSILTQQEIYPQFSDRNRVSINGSQARLEAPDFIVLRRNSPWYSWKSRPSGFNTSIDEAARELFSREDYGLFYLEEDLEVYQREFHDPPWGFAPLFDFQFQSTKEVELWSNNSSALYYTKPTLSFSDDGMAASASEGIAGLYLTDMASTENFYGEIQLEIRESYAVDNWAGFAFRIKDSDNFYFVYVRFPSGEVDLVKHIEGKDEMDLTIGRCNVTRNTKHNLTATVSGQYLNVWMNNVYVGGYNDLSELPTGHIGILLLREDVIFHNITLSSKPQSQSRLTLDHSFLPLFAVGAISVFATSTISEFPYLRTKLGNFLSIVRRLVLNHR